MSLKSVNHKTPIIGLCAWLCKLNLVFLIKNIYKKINQPITNVIFLFACVFYWSSKKHFLQISESVLLQLNSQAQMKRLISVIIILKQVKPYDSKAYPEFFTSNVASQKSLAAHMLKLRTSGTSMSYFGRTALIGISKAPSCKA